MQHILGYNLQATKSENKSSVKYVAHVKPYYISNPIPAYGMVDILLYYIPLPFWPVLKY